MKISELRGKYTLAQLQENPKSKKDVFGQLESEFDYALPQNWLDDAVQKTGLPYNLVMSTCITSYQDSFFGTIFSCCSEVQSELDRYNLS